MTTINKHEECIKNMQPFMEIVAEVNAMIKALIISQEKLITLMCEQSGYPEVLAKEIIRNLDKHS